MAPYTLQQPHIRFNINSLLYVLTGKHIEEAIDVEALAVSSYTHTHTTYTHAHSTCTPAHIRTCASQSRLSQALFQRFQRESLVR
jgi:hypothetical protein